MKGHICVSELMGSPWERFINASSHSALSGKMNGFTSRSFLILITVIFPLMLLAAAVYLGSNVFAVIALLVWIGFGTLVVYLPYTKD